MTPAPSWTAASTLRRIAIGFLGFLGSLAVGCDEPELGDDPCSQMCSEAGYGDVEENADGKGNWTCDCKGSGNGVGQEVCVDYCAMVSPDAEAMLEGSTCSCVSP